jgi:hypothetical protein
MSYSSRFRAALAATVMLAAMGFSSAAQAETCAVSFTMVKSGFQFGTQSGRGVMRCKGRRYPFQISGMSQGIQAGEAETRYNGRVTFQGNPRSVEGIYGAAHAGISAGRGGEALIMTNQNGVVFTVLGRQRGTQINADLSRMTVTMQ